MTRVKKCVILLLVISLTGILHSVNGRYVDQPALYMPEVPEFANEEPRYRRNVEHIVIENEMVIPSELITDKGASNPMGESVGQSQVPQTNEVPNVGLVDSGKGKKKLINNPNIF